MKQNEIVAKVRKELKKHVDLKYRDGERKFFKEPIKNIGVRMPNRKQIARTFWPQVKTLSKKQRWQLIDRLLSGFNEEFTVGSEWLWNSRVLFDKNDLAIFDNWIKKYVDNWAKCDGFCTHSVGYLIDQYPELANKVFVWSRSTNRWFKRAAAVSLIYPWGKPKKYLAQIFKIALALLEDKDDLVQKGYGWMLKEAGNHNQTEVFEFVMKHKSKMPRTALRYAIEKFPSKLKQQTMKL